MLLAKNYCYYNGVMSENMRERWMERNIEGKMLPLQCTDIYEEEEKTSAARFPMPSVVVSLLGWPISLAAIFALGEVISVASQSLYQMQLQCITLFRVQRTSSSPAKDRG